MAKRVPKPPRTNMPKRPNIRPATRFVYVQRPKQNSEQRNSQSPFTRFYLNELRMGEK